MLLFGYHRTMSSTAETTEERQADEAGLTVFRYKIKPLRDAQWRIIQQSLGCQRWVYNQAVAVQKQRMSKGERRLSYKDLCKELTSWKKGQGWLATGPSQALQQTLSGLIRGYQSWRQDPEQFNEPVFKKKGQGKERLIFPTPAHVSWDRVRGRLTLPKIGQLRYFKDKRVPSGTLRRISLGRDGNHLVVCLTIQNDKSSVRTLSDVAKSCGLDWGVVNRVALDDGTIFGFPEDNIQALDVSIAQVQRWISHKVEMRKQIKVRLQSALKNGHISTQEKQAVESELQRKGESKTLRLLRAKLRNLHQKKRFLLNDTRHQITAKIAADTGTVYIEATNNKAMTASARGNHDSPGKNVRQKASLNRQILLTAPGELRRQLKYKTARHGGKVVCVNPAYSSQTCPACENVSSNNRPTRCQFSCTACGFFAPADQVGAINIKRWGLAGIRLAAIKPKKTRPALISRKPRGQQVLDPTQHDLTLDVYKARPGSG